MEIASSSSTTFWIYWMIGFYALVIFLAVIYNFETAEEQSGSRRLLEYATPLVAVGGGIIGAWRLGIVDSSAILNLAGPFLLASQLLVLKVVRDAYLRMNGVKR